jgi:hypothetical protein
MLVPLVQVSYIFAVHHREIIPCSIYKTAAIPSWMIDNVLEIHIYNISYSRRTRPSSWKFEEYWKTFMDYHSIQLEVLIIFFVLFFVLLIKEVLWCQQGLRKQRVGIYVFWSSQQVLKIASHPRIIYTSEQKDQFKKQSSETSTSNSHTLEYDVHQWAYISP